MNELTTRILKILVLVFAVVLASTIFYHLLFQNYKTENAAYYQVQDTSAFEGVYVRNETVQRYSGTGALRYCVNDGAKLGVGSVIAEVYSSPEQIDLAVIPCVTCSHTGERLGHGGGYYDRYFARSPEIFSVMICREEMICENIPRQPHDLIFPVVVTEAGVFRT